METRGKCDRCGEIVFPWEDSTIFDETTMRLIVGRYKFCGFSYGRHIRCSPSRAQYLNKKLDDRYAIDFAKASYARLAFQVMETARLRWRINHEMYEESLTRAIRSLIHKGRGQRKNRRRITSNA